MNTLNGARTSSEDAVETAYHEAGHVLGFLENGWRFLRVTINRTQDARGHVEPDPRQRWETYLTPEFTRRLILRCLAGPVAEAKFQGVDAMTGNWLHDNGAGEDMRHALDAAANQVGDQEEAEALVHWLMVKSRRWVQQDHVWRAIKAVAQALLAQANGGTLSYQQVKKIIRKIDRQIGAEKRVGKALDQRTGLWVATPTDS